MAPVSLTVLGPRDVVGVMDAFRRGLAEHQATINRLNVYPVPDGDTGTNMLLTIEAVVRELDGAPAGGEPDMAQVCRAISHGSLMGARGNSGVILCQILRGLAGSFAEAPKVGVDEVVAGLAGGSAAAREAVLRPAEGTILTVAAEAAEAARHAAGAGDDLDATLDATREAAVRALWRTPELLPVLAQAGVVDAGGAGLVLLYDAFLHVVDDRPLPAELELPERVAAAVAGAQVTPAQLLGAPVAPAGSGAGHGADLRYEVMYFLDAPDEAIPAFREVWAGLGDSIVVVGGEGLWNCHIHTDDVGAAIEAALDAGRPREIRVTDLAEQVEEEQWVRSAEAAGEGGPEPAGSAGVLPAPRTSIVAVATGEGIRRIFRSLGADHIVAGGQSMNPSTAEILEVVESVPGAEVVVLPNNSNIFPVAAQVAEIATKTVRVLATKGIQEGFAALIEFDPEASSEENARVMGEAAERVAAGEVTRAVRASDTAVGPVVPGDWIGLSRTGVVSVATSLADATSQLIERLLEPGREIVTLIEGAGSSAAETRRVTEWLHAEHPELTVELHHGGQPLYPFLVSIE